MVTAHVAAFHVMIRYNSVDVEHTASVTRVEEIGYHDPV
jgi:hypothetical protein